MPEHSGGFFSRLIDCKMQGKTASAANPTSSLSSDADGFSFSSTLYMKILKTFHVVCSSAKSSGRSYVHKFVLVHYAFVCQGNGRVTLL